MNWLVWMGAGALTVIVAPYVFRFLYREGYALIFLVGNGGPIPYLRYLKDNFLRLFRRREDY